MCSNKHIVRAGFSIIFCPDLSSILDFEHIISYYKDKKNRYTNRLKFDSKIDFKKEPPKSQIYKPVLISEREARRRFERLRALLQASGGSLSRRMKCCRASSSQILFPAVSHHIQIFSGALASAPLREHLKFEDDLLCRCTFRYP